MRAKKKTRPVKGGEALKKLRKPVPRPTLVHKAGKKNGRKGLKREIDDMIEES